MINSFNKQKSIYDAQDLIAFSEDKEALLWLKIKSIVRKETISEFCDKNTKNRSELNQEKLVSEPYKLKSLEFLLIKMQNQMKFIMKFLKSLKIEIQKKVYMF